MADRPLAGYGFVLATLLATAVGQVLLKWRASMVSAAPRGRFGYLGDMFMDPFVWAGLFMAVGASVCWMLAVRALPLTVAYPFMALGFVLVPVLALLFLGERLSLLQVLGMGLIVLGVALSSAPR